MPYGGSLLLVGSRPRAGARRVHLLGQTVATGFLSESFRQQLSGANEVSHIQTGVGYDSTVARLPAGAANMPKSASLSVPNPLWRIAHQHAPQKYQMSN